jgi:transglutaminase-like putative cysteine protease
MEQLQSQSQSQSQSISGGHHAAERYAVEHETRYAYTAPVSQSWQLAHLVPRALPWQRLLSYKLHIEPTPDERHDAPDSFGNSVTHFALHGAHRQLCVRMECVVEVGPRPACDAGMAEVAWEVVRDAVHHDPQLDDLVPARMREGTLLVPWSEAARVYAAPSFGPGRGWLASVTALMQRIHHEFEFEAGATTVSTSVDEVLYQKRGVCQDFAHLMLACLRSHGLPARYVSGYLLTEPPPGQERLMGVDASHAWVAAYAPQHGWVEFDPTNSQLADARYITLAWGADFADVVPLRGVILGGGEQDMVVEVSVVPGV